MDKNQNNLTVKIKKIGLILLLLTGVLALLLLASCNGVVPGPPTPPGPDDDVAVADNHKVTAIAPYYEIEEAKHYCLISKGIIVTNYEENYGVENPQIVLTQQELADAIFGIAGATVSDLINYINSRGYLNLKAEIQYLPILEMQKMLEDDIVPIVIGKTGTTVYLPVGYDKIKEEVTIYGTLSGKEFTLNQFDKFNLNNNKSVIIINKKRLSTYLDNLL